MLYDIGYVDCGTLRSIVYCVLLVEMFVFYGDLVLMHRFKNVFDMGEYGVGWFVNLLVFGCDCLGEICYFDGVVND